MENDRLRIDAKQFPNRANEALAWAAAEIDRFQMALKAARSNLHEIEAGDMSTFEAMDAINIALGEAP